MKSIGKMWIVIVSITLLGWLTAGAGTDGMMKEKMDDTSQGMMADKMNDADKNMKGNEMDTEKGAMNGGKSMMSARKAMLEGSDGHHATGTVTFDTGMNDKKVLTLSNITVDKVPDGYVYLTKDGDRLHGVVLGELKQFSGTVSFDLPAGVMAEDYDSVIIWCKKFNVEIGRAYFGKEKM